MQPGDIIKEDHSDGKKEGLGLKFNQLDDYYIR